MSLVRGRQQIRPASSNALPWIVSIRSSLAGMIYVRNGCRKSSGARIASRTGPAFSPTPPVKNEGVYAAHGNRHHRCELLHFQ